MGWWGPGIFDGDEPLDAYAFLVDHVDAGHLRARLTRDGYPVDPTGFDQATVDAWRDVADVAAKVTAFAERRLREPVAVQVAAATLLAAGVAVPARLRQMAVEACKADPWAGKNPARAAAVDGLAAMVQAQLAEEPGPVTFVGQSLADAVAAARAAGVTGLVNQPGSYGT